MQQTTVKEALYHVEWCGPFGAGRRLIGHVLGGVERAASVEDGELVEDGALC
jgi:hypothetical protein